MAPSSSVLKPTYIVYKDGFNGVGDDFTQSQKNHFIAETMETKISGVWQPNAV